MKTLKQKLLRFFAKPPKVESAQEGSDKLAEPLELSGKMSVETPFSQSNIAIADQSDVES